MYRPGHYGVALLVAAPIAFVLGWPSGAAFSAIVLATTMLPDLDTRLSSVRHRGVTHTVVFALGVGLLGYLIGVVGWYAAIVFGRSLTLEGAGTFVSGASFLGVCSHLVADALTPGYGPNSMRPFWPVSRRAVRLGVARVDSLTWNWGLLTVGVLAQAVALSLTSWLN